MLRYPCLVLDHDDTVVQSEATINYPFFVEYLKEYRPGMTITLEEYVTGCCEPGYIEMCRRRFGFSEAELKHEYDCWKAYIRSHIPPAYPGIERIIRRQKAAGGVICVVSQSAQENILRDYRTHFGLEPDDIFGWDLPPEQRKPDPYALNRIMEKYGLSPAQLLVLDDMKPAWEMARRAGVEIGFAAWGRLDYPGICGEMERLCDYTFRTTEDLETFLFEEDAK